MNEFLILRLRNAAIDMDNRGNNNLAHLLTEAIAALEKQSEKEGFYGLKETD